MIRNVGDNKIQTNDELLEKNKVSYGHELFY